MSLCEDRISYQAKAVLAYLNAHEGVEDSWDDEHKCYRATPYVSEWHNGRENGYVVTMKNMFGCGDQLNIAFFEHRNSDHICAIRWVQNTGPNPPNLCTSDFGNVYRNKYDVSYEVPYGQPAKMADWIYQELGKHWKDGKNDW